jgi:hypothetical protein
MSAHQEPGIEPGLKGEANSVPDVLPWVPSDLMQYCSIFTQVWSHFLAHLYRSDMSCALYTTLTLLSIILLTPGLLQS